MAPELTCAKIISGAFRLSSTAGYDVLSRDSAIVQH